MKDAWQRLELGDIVDIVAPAFLPDEEDFQRGVELLEDWGLKPRFPQDIFGPDLLCAQNLEKRRYFFHKAMTAPDSKVVWCARGGYGSWQMLMDMERTKPPAQPKLLVGYSDITVLHNFLIQKWDWPVLHGPLVDGLGAGKIDSSSLLFLKEGLFKERDYTYTLEALNSSAQQTKELSGRVLGGNLAMVQTTLGTSLQMDFNQGFLFLEDIGERGYKIERMLSHIEQASQFKGLQAILFGRFTGGEEPNGGNLVWSVIERWAEQKDIPVFSGVPCGHGHEQHPLFLNTPALVNGGDKPALIFSSGSK